MHALAKSATGIAGLDELTFGGLPAGRPSLVCGAAGCGKTIFAISYLVNGAVKFGEGGVFMSFEERAVDLEANVASLGYDLSDLVAKKQLAIDHVHIERSEIEESGDYDLEGLFVRLAHAIDAVGAKRVVLDTIEALFSGLTDTAVLRAEIRRLFGWLKDRGVTAIITAERGDGTLTRYGIEEYVSDCVILLDNRVTEQVTTRLLRVIKYRGSAHGTNEYPFLIDADGISVLPITSAGRASHIGRNDFDRHRRPRRDARGQGLLRRVEHPDFRACGNRQIHVWSLVRQCGLRTRQACVVLRLRRVAGPDRAEHEVGRHRVEASRRGRTARVRGRATESVRIRDAPGAHEPRHRTLQTRRHRGRSDFGIPGTRVRDPCDAHTPRGHLQGQGHHGAVHQSVFVRRCDERQRSQRVVNDGHMVVAE
jgi:KaiC/GvpD/RAD55 family RecA-like ATPase